MINIQQHAEGGNGVIWILQRMSWIWFINMPPTRKKKPLPGAPALAAASYPFVDLPPGSTLRCKLFPSDKFLKSGYTFQGGLSIMKPITNRELSEE